MITVVLLRPLGVMLIISSAGVATGCLCRGECHESVSHITSITLYILAKLGAIAVNTVTLQLRDNISTCSAFTSSLVTLRLIVCGEITIVMIVVRVARDGGG